MGYLRRAASHRCALEANKHKLIALSFQLFSQILANSPILKVMFRFTLHINLQWEGHKLDIVLRMDKCNCAIRIQYWNNGTVLERWCRPELVLRVIPLSSTAREQNIYAWLTVRPTFVIQRTRIIHPYEIKCTLDDAHSNLRFYDFGRLSYLLVYPDSAVRLDVKKFLAFRRHPNSYCTKAILRRRTDRRTSSRLKSKGICRCHKQTNARIEVVDDKSHFTFISPSFILYKRFVQRTCVAAIVLV